MFVCVKKIGQVALIFILTNSFIKTRFSNRLSTIAILSKIIFFILFHYLTQIFKYQTFVSIVRNLCSGFYLKFLKSSVRIIEVSLLYSFLGMKFLGVGFVCVNACIYALIFIGTHT